MYTYAHISGFSPAFGIVAPKPTAKRLGSTLSKTRARLALLPDLKRSGLTWPALRDSLTRPAPCLTAPLDEDSAYDAYLRYSREMKALRNVGKDYQLGEPTSVVQKVISA